METRETLNDAEELVYRVCKRSFLSLWSYANPQGEDGKELCDILVVCEPHVIILSVKDIKLTNSGREEVDWARWRRKAIAASSRQLYGAETFLRTASHVIRKDGTSGLPLSSNAEWRFHRVAVALGSQGKVPLEFGDFGRGFVHVFDERSFTIILQELNTVADFVSYLASKECVYESGVATVFDGAEEDLLALYLHQGRKFPEGPDVIVVGTDMWDALSRRDEFLRRKEADRESYVWDRLIEEMCKIKPDDHTEAGPTLTETELALRVMARETRFGRRVLGKAYREFLLSIKKNRSRMAQSLSPGVAYVFLHVAHGEDRESCEAELEARCFIARGTIPECMTVVGICTEEWRLGAGCHSYLLYLHMPTWTADDQSCMEETKRRLGYFRTPIWTRLHEDEYPVSQAAAHHNVVEMSGHPDHPVEPS